jgi:alkylhydroperoxidase family enzyme
MPRLRQVPRAEVTDPDILAQYDRLFGGRDPVAEPGTKTGSPGNWWTVFANSPQTFGHAMAGFNYYLNNPRKLDTTLRELGQTRAGWLVGSQFVFSQHCKSCRGIGMPEEKIAAIPTWEISDIFDDRERTVLAYTDCLVGSHGRVPDVLFDKLKSYLSDEEIVELSYITGMYIMHAILSRALKLEFDDRDDPVVEVAAPKEYSGGDFMAMQNR